MISLLIGGTVVLCIGLLAVVFGIPIKEFSFGNTMILAGAGVSCTGLILIGLYFVGREVRALAQRLESGIPVSNPMAPRERVPAPAKSHAAHDDTLFTRDQTSDPAPGRDDFTDPLPDNRTRAPSPLAGPAESPAPWQDHPVTRARPPAPPTETFEPPAEPAERPRRNIMFSSHRRDAGRDVPPRDSSAPSLDEPIHRPVADEAPDRDAESASVSQSADPFDSAWPQPAARSRAESSPVRNRRAAPPETEDDHAPEAAGERFQPPRRADESSVTIVKSGVVDSMAYSLYSDGSIEAQMPEGMVRFASIDELRAHLDERG